MCDLGRRSQVLIAMCSLIVALSLSGCSGDAEPDDKTVREQFSNNSAAYEELRAMLWEDVRKSDVSFVSADYPERTQCGQKPQRHRCSMPVERWNEYQQRFKVLGIVWLEYIEPSERFYFVTYYRSFGMDARLRGIVSCKDTSAQPSSFYPKQEWQPLYDGWYSFLMVDS